MSKYNCEFKTKSVLMNIMLFLRRELFSNIDVEDACSNDELRRFIMKTLRFIVNHASVPKSLIRRPEWFPYVFYFATYMDLRLWVRFATAVSKREAMHSVASEWGEYGVVSPSVINDLSMAFYPCSNDEVLGMSEDCEPIFKYAVKWVDWVKAFCCYNDPNYKLVNQYMVSGYVLLSDEKQVRKYVEMRVRNEVLALMFRALGFTKEEGEGLTKALLRSLTTTVSEVIKNPPAPRLSGVDCKLINWITQLQPREVSRGGKPVVRVNGEMPPCIESIINEIKSGGNPSHQARFAVAAYMLRRCHDLEGRSMEDCVEDVVNLFRTAADFNEKKTKYQVEHIAGLRGGHKFYMPPSCQEMNSLGLCPTNLGCGVKNPIQFLRINLRRNNNA